ncbi:MAG: hypothetical protein AB7J13_11035 [Pyrinomonadaceae bacterium]
MRYHRYRDGRSVGLFIALITILASSYATPGQSNTDLVTFNFSGYGNPQRPFPGYVGPYQLGQATISGSGVVNRRSGALVRGGTITHADNLRGPRYPNHRTTWQVVRMIDLKSSGDVSILRLGVQVVSSNYTQICPVGTYGILELADDNRLMANRQTRDSVRTEMPNPSSSNAERTLACGTHTHGMNNDNYTWTDPPFGGPGGGIWANVEITAARRPLQITNLRYPKQIKGDGVKHDMTVWWQGDPQYPLKVVFAPTSCPAGVNCITETRTFSAPTNPLVGRGMVWCTISGAVVWNWKYHVYLEDANGNRSNQVAAPGVCNNSRPGVR